jgi:general secretion pathway protein A
MYTQKFGLKLDPFSIAPDPRFLYMSERHREALAHLLWGVSGPTGAAGGSGGGFVLLTGDIGAGKTTICRCFLQQVPAHCNVGYIFNPKLSVIELLESICEEFHVTLPPDKAIFPTAKAYIDALNAHLLDRHAAGESCVLIIDEAQNLAPEVLEQLRLLTNLETAERKLLQIILIGQPELRSMLARPDMEQLAQRVIARCHLDALNLAETKQYIAHRLAVAGLTDELPFDAPALKRIHELTRGVPRRINLLCGRALLGAWALGEPMASRSTVDQAAKEVFGTEHIGQANASQRRTRIALTALVLLLAGAVGALAIWSNTPKPQPPAPASMPAH